jgi:hypothetical protein
MPIYSGRTLEAQDHAAMNACILRNLLAWFRCNEQKAIAKVRKHITLEWDRLQVNLQYTLEVPRLTFVKLTFTHILRMITWGVWGHPS